MNASKLAVLVYGIFLGYQAHKYDLVNRGISRARKGMQEIQRDNARAFLSELRGDTLHGPS